MTFLLFVVVISIIGIIAGSMLENKLSNLFAVAQKDNPRINKANNILLLLYRSENEFQSSVFTNNKDGRVAYRNNLKTVFEQIDSISQDIINSDLYKKQRERVEMRTLYEKKASLSGNVLQLKERFDSLLATIDNASTGNAQMRIDSFKNSKRYATLRVDTTTVKGETNVKKRGFFKRLKDVFNSKGDTLTNAGQVNINANSNHYSDSLSHVIAYSADQYYQQSLAMLRKRQGELNERYRNLLEANQLLISELANVIEDLQATDQQMADTLRRLATKEYQSAFSIMKTVGDMGIILIVLFSVALIYYIYTINKKEKELVKEHEMAINLAQQKTDLLAIMTHEIRTPLTTIIGFLKALGKSGISDHQKGMMEAIQLSSDMLLASVNDVLDMSKLESGLFQLQSEEFNPYNVIRSVIDNMQLNASGKKLDLQFNYSGDKKINLIGDVLRLKQILLNMISNAIKYTDKGFVKVDCKVVQEGKSVQLHFAIIDSGRGISKSQQGKLFSKYFQANAVGTGSGSSGLGLYICYKLIQLQKGNISVDSEPGKGTTFTISIPYTEANAPANVVTSGTPAVNASVFSEKKIMIVDDNKLNLQLYEIIMSDWNVKLWLMQDVKAALDILKKEQVDLVITDMHMGDMSGKDLVHTLRSFNNKVSVLLVTGYRYNASEIAALKNDGFTDVMIKPFNKIQLAQRINAVL